MTKIHIVAACIGFIITATFADPLLAKGRYTQGEEIKVSPRMMHAIEMLHDLYANTGGASGGGAIEGGDGAPGSGTGSPYGFKISTAMMQAVDQIVAERRKMSRHR